MCNKNFKKISQYIAARENAVDEERCNSLYTPTPPHTMVQLYGQLMQPRKIHYQMASGHDAMDYIWLAILPTIEPDNGDN